jgi:hypothetical protein
MKAEHKVIEREEWQVKIARQIFGVDLFGGVQHLRELRVRISRILRYVRHPEEKSNDRENDIGVNMIGTVGDVQHLRKCASEWSPGFPASA